jgi:predicted O-methyltransferase YrrM
MPGEDAEETALDAVSRVFATVPHMTPQQGRIAFDHLVATGARDVLDIGTCYGTSAAYFAAAVIANGGGRVTSVDSGRFDDSGPALEWVETGLRDSGVRDVVELVRIEDSSYAWWLKEQVERFSDADGRCEPQYDFVYLDGAKSLTIDGVSVLFIERLLRPGGWLLLDDIEWTYTTNPEVVQTEGVHYPMSDAELHEPHIRAVLELIIKPSGAFSVIRRQEEGQWAWAQKSAGGDRTRYEVYYEQSLTDRVLRRALALKGRLRS